LKAPDPERVRRFCVDAGLVKSGVLFLGSGKMRTAHHLPMLQAFLIQSVHPIECIPL
jgi:hypothetical protein